MVIFITSKQSSYRLRIFGNVCLLWWTRVSFGKHGLHIWENPYIIFIHSEGNQKSNSLSSNFSCCWEQTPFASKVPNSNPILPTFKIPLNYSPKDCGSVEVHLWADVTLRLCFVPADWQPPSALFAPDWKQATLPCHLWQQWGCSVHATNHQW